jgi:hypothetical protein
MRSGAVARFCWLVAAMTIGEILSAGGPERLTVSGVAAGAGRSALLLAAGFALVELCLIGAGRFSARARARLDRQLHAMLRGAAARIPGSRRAVYLREWEGELHAILAGPAARPVLRLWPALRYVAGLRRAAPAIARLIEPEQRPSGSRVRRVGRGLREFGLVLVLTPIVGPVVLLFVGLIVAGMLLVAVWAAVLTAVLTATAANTARPFRQTFEAGCRASGLCLFGYPAPADPPGEQTLLSL